MMSGAVWVRDQLALAGWEVQVAHARKVRDVAPLACKTDKVDARVLAELCRRDLVPELWVPRSRTARSASACAAALTWSRPGPRRATGSSACSPSSACGSPTPGCESPTRWSCWSAAGCRGLAGLDRRAARADRRDGRAHRADRPRAPPAGASDERARLLQTMPGIGPLLSLTFAAEIGEVSRFSSPASSSATRAWRRGSASRASARRPARSRRPARGPCAGRRSRPPTRPGGPPTPGTATTCGSRPATARTRRSRRSPASS